MAQSRFSQIAHICQFHRGFLERCKVSGPRGIDAPAGLALSEDGVTALQRGQPEGESQVGRLLAEEGRCHSAPSTLRIAIKPRPAHDHMRGLA